MKYVVVTGVSTGIGHAIVSELLERDMYVFGSVRNIADAERLSLEFGDRFQPLIFDVTDSASVKKGIKTVEEILGDKNGLFGLVNNAGIAVAGALQHMPADKVKQQFDVNVLGLVSVTQACLPLLGARLNYNLAPGRIVNISSVAADISTPFQTIYGASKAAVESITDGWRRELMAYGIDVISIQPGPIRSEIWSKVNFGDMKYEDTIYHPLIEQMKKFLVKTASQALPAAQVSQKVALALTANRPKSGYLVYKSKTKFFLAKYLPTRIFDKVYKKQWENVLGRKL